MNRFFFWFHRRPNQQSHNSHQCDFVTIFVWFRIAGSTIFFHLFDLQIQPFHIARWCFRTIIKSTHTLITFINFISKMADTKIMCRSIAGKNVCKNRVRMRKRERKRKRQRARKCAHETSKFRQKKQLLWLTHHLPYTFILFRLSSPQNVSVHSFSIQKLLLVKIDTEKRQRGRTEREKKYNSNKKKTDVNCKRTQMSMREKVTLKMKKKKKNQR